MPFETFAFRITDAGEAKALSCLIQAKLVGATAIVRIFQLNRVVFPPANVANDETTGCRLAEGVEAAAGTRKPFRVHGCAASNRVRGTSVASGSEPLSALRR